MQRKTKEIFLAEIAGMISRHNISQNRRDADYVGKKIKLTEYEGESRNLFMPLKSVIFDIDVFYNRIIIDAKSMLGVLSLDLSKRINRKIWR